MGVGVPDAATVKVTEPPATTLWLAAGCVVIVGATVVGAGGGVGGGGVTTGSATTVSTPALLVALPATFVTKAAYVALSFVVTDGRVNVVPVAPAMTAPFFSH